MGHTSSRNRTCINHNMSTKELMIERFGKSYQTYTIKCGVNSVVRPQYREQFVERVNELSIFTRSIIVRTQILVNTYLLEQTGPIPAIFFEQQFFYSVMQIVQQKRVTTTNSQVPKEALMQVWSNLLSRHPQLRSRVVTDASTISTVLADCAVLLATTYSNNVALNLEKRITSFFLHKLSCQFPVSTCYQTLLVSRLT
jgi:hypothetical protein